MPSFNGELLNYLPAIYHKSEDLCVLLSVFEAVLFGPDGQELNKERRRESINQTMPIVDSIATISSLFDAYETPKDFLPWLARWVALTHLEGLSEKRQRQLLAEIVPLYAQRGTRKYLERLLELFKPKNASVSIEDQELQGLVVGATNIGIDSRLERDRPFWFKVKILAPARAMDPDERRESVAEWDKRIRQVIDLAKPAHTLYELDWQLEAKEKRD